MANMIGANHVVRVAALNDIRFYAGHLTEDLLTGMRLHAQGWKSVYVPEPLAVGEGPETWKAYFTQQMRWAHGCMDILRWHTPTLAKKMSKTQACSTSACSRATSAASPGCSASSCSSATSSPGSRSPGSR